MNDAWNYVWEKLFCEKTNLFYDYLTNHNHEQRFDHLPLLEEIEIQFPNPGGWGTGMEDSMLNAGSIMDVLRLRWELTGDPNALKMAEQVLSGMCNCAEVHGTRGFVVRSISPRDGHSCYFNSSRDQFTLCVYGAWRFLRSFHNSDDSFGEKAKTLLADIASYCEQTVTIENSFDLLRLDGKPALVSKMVNVTVHQIMQLPMFYAAAWDATKNPHWFELYRKYAVPAIEENFNLDPDHPWWDIELSQMQISLALLVTVEPEPELRGKYHEAMRLVAELAEKYLRIELRKAQEFAGDWDSLNSVWRTMDMRVRGEILKTPQSSALYGGYAYLLPRFPEQYEIPYSLLRAVGNLLYTIMLSPDFSPAPAIIEAFAEIAAKPDYPAHGSDAPINVLHGYWMTRSRGLIA